MPLEPWNRAVAVSEGHPELRALKTASWVSGLRPHSHREHRKSCPFRDYLYLLGRLLEHNSSAWRKPIPFLAQYKCIITP
jgi:hypothetical protein